MKKSICILFALFMSILAWAQTEPLKKAIDELPDYPLNITTIQNLYDYYMKLESVYLEHRVVNERPDDVENDEADEIAARYKEKSKEFEDFSEEELMEKALTGQAQGGMVATEEMAKTMKKYSKIEPEYIQMSHIEDGLASQVEEVSIRFEKDDYNKTIRDYITAVTDGMGFPDPQQDIIIDNKYAEIMPQLYRAYNEYYFKDSLLTKSLLKREAYVTQGLLPCFTELVNVSQKYTTYLGEMGVPIKIYTTADLEDMYRKELLKMLDSRISVTADLIRYYAYKGRIGIFYLISPQNDSTPENEYHPSEFIYYTVPKMLKGEQDASPGSSQKNEKPQKNEKAEKAKKLLKSLF